MMLWLLSISLCVVVLASITQEPLKYDSIQINPYFPLLENENTTCLFPMPRCGSFILNEATIDQMQDAMSNSTLTSVELMLCYMQRTYQTQQYINSVIQINPDALAIAKAMDNERSSGNVRGPLHGIPFTVKDNIGTKDNMETTAGSWALVGSIVPRDAFVVSRLRKAGAVLLGKAGLSEWAEMRTNNHSVGYSARGGQVRNPYNLKMSPGGSSSGSAAGVAANAIAFSLGTETDGSILHPAERNGIVGIKPTVGLTSRAGVIPESEHQDTVGTFGRTVKDATYAFDAIYGVDERDNYTFAQRGKTPVAGYVQFLRDWNALKNATFGLPWKSLWVYASIEQQRVLKEIILLMQNAGATIVNETEITNYQSLVSPAGWDWDFGTNRGYPNESEYTVVKVDFYNNIKKYLSELENTNIRSLEDIIQYNYDNTGTEGGHPYPRGIPAFYSGQDLFLDSLATKGIRDETYWQALAWTQSKTRQGIDDALTYQGHKLSGLLVPADVAQSAQIAAQAGYPVITIPAYVRSGSGVPFGLAIMQTAWAEDELIKWGSAIEDLQRASGIPYKRTLPTWREHRKRNIPVVMEDDM